MLGGNLFSFLALLLATPPNHSLYFLYTVDKADESWPFSVGFINEAMVRERLLPAAPDAVAAMCGPPPMIKFACLPNLKQVGFTPEQCIEF